MSNNHACKNCQNHISAFPAFDREPCPVCGKSFVRKIKRESK